MKITSLIVKTALIVMLTFPYLSFCQEENGVTLTSSYGNEVFTIVENPPKFKGGEKKFIKYLKRNSKFSITSKKGDLNVFIQFVINKKGGIEDISFIKPIEEELPSNIKKDILRLFDIMPLWIPGTQNGETVNVIQVKRITYIFG